MDSIHRERTTMCLLQLGGTAGDNNWHFKIRTNVLGITSKATSFIVQVYPDLVMSHVPDLLL